jgi:hypothetical protein
MGSARVHACSSRRLAAKKKRMKAGKTGAFLPTVLLRSAGAPTAAREGACAPRIEFQFSDAVCNALVSSLIHEFVLNQRQNSPRMPQV